MTDQQKCVLVWMLEKNDVSSNDAGQRLSRAGLMKKSGAHYSNKCLAGSSVLRSLERIGLAASSRVGREYTRRMYYLTAKGGKIAGEIIGGQGEKAQG